MACGKGYVTLVAIRIIRVTMSISRSSVTLVVV